MQVWFAQKDLKVLCKDTGYQNAPFDKFCCQLAPFTRACNMGDGKIEIT
jgi:hypothetical protein